MYEPQPKLTVREMIRETFTPSRVGVLSWAFAAVIMGTVGLASFQFGGQAMLSSSKRMLTGTFTLPPGGDVSTTASIRSVGTSTPVEIMRMPATESYGDAAGLTRSQIEVLQRELVGLRRRLSALSEQNLTYSRRIAALEQEVAVTKLSGSAHSGSGDAMNPAEPGPGVIITKAAPETGRLQGGSGRATPAPVANAAPDRPEAAPESAPEAAMKARSMQAALREAQVSRPSPESVPRRISIYREQKPSASIPGVDINTQDPVRIVSLPDADGNPQTTGSIPPQSAGPAPEAFDATPTSTSPQPMVVAPSKPAGKFNGRGASQVNRSDFGAVIGHYETEAAAAAAWARFKEQNRDRVHDMHPLLTKRLDAKGGIALLVGPFANAADAAVACLHLLDVAALCHPTLFAGESLVTTAEFRGTAF
ncbi:hypothetical protein [Roseibium marinum]|uniref:SPOR domain-containing protein n=1 Tax=Roseibium marinum TaxID=281252 RepID=A0A2S3UR98_9HYPH|nr:hypothetical protein [Roseibium marinum]POF30093.1 hypothetical protein CLV41_107119 [Roseibium marinum]